MIGLLTAQLHTLIVLVAFLAVIVAYAWGSDPAGVDKDLLLLLGGAVAGTAGTAFARSSS